MKNKYDVIVVGGGVMGCSITYNLSTLGKKVLLVEKEDIAKGSAGATDGVIGYHTKKPGVHMELAKKSIELFEYLEKNLDMEIELKHGGGMLVAQTKEEFEILSDITKEQIKSGIDIRILNIDEAREVEPQLSKKLYGAMYCPSSKQVNPLKLTLAYAATAKRLGSEILIGCGVEEFILDKEKNRVVGVRTNKGDFYSDKVVNACGAMAGILSSLINIDTPIKPRRGQLIVTEPMGKFIKTTIQCGRYNVIKFLKDKTEDEDIKKMGLSLSIEQTEEGALIIGSTRELVGFNKENTFEAIEKILRRAKEFFPTLKDVNVIRCFSGLRPFTPDGLPIISKSKDIDGYYIGAGHEGDGIALAPITGKLLAELLVYGESSYPLDSFRDDRF